MTGEWMHVGACPVRGRGGGRALSWQAASVVFHAQPRHTRICHHVHGCAVWLLPTPMRMGAAYKTAFLLRMVHLRRKVTQQLLEPGNPIAPLRAPDVHRTFGTIVDALNGDRRLYPGDWDFLRERLVGREEKEAHERMAAAVAALRLELTEAHPLPFPTLKRRVLAIVDAEMGPLQERLRLISPSTIAESLEKVIKNLRADVGLLRATNLHHARSIVTLLREEIFLEFQRRAEEQVAVVMRDMRAEGAVGAGLRAAAQERARAIFDDTIRQAVNHVSALPQFRGLGLGLVAEEPLDADPQAVGAPGVTPQQHGWLNALFPPGDPDASAYWRPGDVQAVLKEIRQLAAARDLMAGKLEAACLQAINRQAQARLRELAHRQAELEAAGKRASTEWRELAAELEAEQTNAKRLAEELVKAQQRAQDAAAAAQRAIAAAQAAAAAANNRGGGC